jgi:hypothetical protein
MADRHGVEALDPDSWDALADLAERHSGVWNGCWHIMGCPPTPMRTARLSSSSRTRASSVPGTRPSGSNDTANLDDGDLWPVSYAIKKWTRQKTRRSLSW